MDFWVETDAPLQGWGARFEQKMKGGRWTHEEGVLQFTCNILELLAICFALNSF